MMNSELWLSQIQFYLSLGFMSLFLVTELGLAWVLLFFKICAHRSAGAAWTAAYRFWVRVFALAFILTFASSMPVLIQFGSLWPSLMNRIGEIAGPLLAAAIFSTFIFKSCFLGAMLFGHRHLSERVHTFIVFMVAVGVTVSALWLVILQSWMQTPAGGNISDGQYRVTDWAGVIFNPSVGWYAGLLMLTSVLTVAFLLAGVSAIQSLHRPVGEGERLVFRTALIMGVAGVILQGVVGAGAGQALAPHQPAKAAATAAYWHSDSKPELLVFAWPDSATKSNRAAVALPYEASRWLGRDASGAPRGLDQFSGMSPPVAVTFWSFRIALYIWILMALVSVVSFFRARRHQFDPGGLSRGWRWILTGMTFSGWAMCLAGMSHTFFGLYPYAVNGTVTISEISGNVQGDVLLGGIVVHVLFYLVFLAGFFQLLGHIERYGVVPVARRRGRA